MTGPETIWAWQWNLPYSKHDKQKTWQPATPGKTLVFKPWVTVDWPGLRFWNTVKEDHYQSVDEYRRADLPATDAQALANDKVRALVEALKEIAAILQAAVASGNVRGGDSYRIGGVYLQTVSDALGAAEAALAALEKDSTE